MSSEELRLSNGVVLRFKPVAPWIITEARKRIPEPVPPMMKNPDTGLDEEDWEHPLYKRALEHYGQQRSDVTSNALLYFGVEIVSVPKGMAEYGGSEWRKELELFGITIDDRWPRVDWLKYIALRGEEVQLVLRAIDRAGSVREEDVQTTEASFRDNSERRDDPDPAIADHSANGHRVRGTAIAGAN